jgi:predicted nucleic acid-binding protein
VFDANALYPALYRDLVLRFAQQGKFHPIWSDQILEELIRALKRRTLFDSHKIENLAIQLNEAFPEALINTRVQHGYAIECRDQNDQHVLDLALNSRSQVLVTFNLRDFPIAAALDHGLNVLHPDDFLSDAMKTNRGSTEKILDQIQSNYRKPNVSLEDLAQQLRNSNCPKSAALLQIS